VSRWRPSPGEERWLEVTTRLGGALPRGALAERTGGWRSTGPLARAALFVLGFVAAVLLFGILGFGDESMLLVAGLITAAAAEWLTVARRFHGSGIEEGLCLSGFLMVGVWITTITGSPMNYADGRLVTLVPIAAVGLAGLRLLNPFVTACAAVAFLDWAGSTGVAREIDKVAGAGLTELALGCALAALALALGARTYQRPSYDRMLDWLVATLPVATYVLHAGLSVAARAGAVPAAGAVGHLPVTMLLFAIGAAMLVAGLRRRRHAPLLGFMGCVACLAVELHLATTPRTETWLILCGLVALVAGVALDLYLRQPRSGITSARLTDREGPLDLLQTAGAAVLAGREEHGQPPAPGPRVAQGEGRFGGGGASGSY
jgi:uncharacterized membrane protein YgcG